jgi:hypothetical protein
VLSVRINGRDEGFSKIAKQPWSMAHEDIHRGIRAGIRKSVLALLQVNNIKMALTLERRAVGKAL